MVEIKVIKFKSKAIQTSHFDIITGRNQKSKIWGINEKKKKTTNKGIIKEASM